MGGVLVALGLLGAFVAFALSQSGTGGGSSSPSSSSTSVPADLPQRLETFLASNPSPEQIEAVARELEGAGLRETASQLRAIAAQRRASASAPATTTPAPGSSTSPTLPPPPLPPGPRGEAARVPEPSPSAAAPETTREQGAAPVPPPPSPATTPPAAGTREETLEEELERAGPTARASFERAMREAGPADLRVVAQGVRSRGGFPRIVAALEARATELEVAARASPGVPAPAASEAQGPASSPSAPPPSASSPASTAAVDLRLARRLAPRVADDIRERRYSYNRDRLREFQRAAGLAADGLYGGTSRGALIYFGVRNAPPALYQPTTTVRYQPPAGAAQAST